MLELFEGEELWSHGPSPLVQAWTGALSRVKVIFE